MEGTTNPYLTYQLGERVAVSLRNMVQFATYTPSFYRVEERDIVLPSEARLQINLLHHDDGIGVSERLIGSTIIHLEDRWHSAAWRGLMGKHLTEHRPLVNPKSGCRSTGSLEMWIELVESCRASELQAAELRKPAAVEIEVRLVIRTCKVKLTAEEKADLKLIVELECQDYKGANQGFPSSQETDTHFGSEGTAIFNWRVVFPKISTPTKSCTMDLKLYRANAITADQFIGAVSVDLQRYVEKVAEDMDAIYLEKADLHVCSSDKTTSDAESGSVQFEMWVMTQTEANGTRAGLGRDEPNEWPQLVAPTEGRGWGDVLASTVSFQISWLPDIGIWKHALPLIAFTLLCVLMFRLS